MPQAPGTATTWTVGDATVTSIIEFDVVIPGQAVLREATPEALLGIDWLRPTWVDDVGNIVLRIQLFVVESCGRRIAIDACVGNDKARTNPFFDHLQLPFLEWMRAAGYPPESIDTVVCTHMHNDHVGWNTMHVDGAWVPTFPNARYLFDRVEYEHWLAYGIHEDGDVHGDSVEPILTAGLADLTEPGHRITDEVWCVPTPGHTPGHQSVRIESAGERAIITGDVIHHPSQCAEPSWSSWFDSDVDAARATRVALLRQEATDGTTVFGTHFTTPTCGRVVVDGTSFRFI